MKTFYVLKDIIFLIKKRNNMSKLTVKEIKEQLDQDSIKYTSKMTKQQLIELMSKPVEEEHSVLKEPVVLMSQKHFRFNPVNETVDPVITKVIDDVFRERSEMEPVKKSRKNKEVKKEELPVGKLEELLVQSEEPEVKKRSLWVDCIKDYCKSKGTGYKIYPKDSNEYKEILDLYNKKKTSKQV